MSFHAKSSANGSPPVVDSGHVFAVTTCMSEEDEGHIPISSKFQNIFPPFLFISPKIYLYIFLVKLKHYLLTTEKPKSTKNCFKNYREKY